MCVLQNVEVGVLYSFQVSMWDYIQHRRCGRAGQSPAARLLHCCKLRKMPPCQSTLPARHTLLCLAVHDRLAGLTGTAAPYVMQIPRRLSYNPREVYSKLFLFDINLYSCGIFKCTILNCLLTANFPFC